MIHQQPMKTLNEEPSLSWTVVRCMESSVFFGVDMVFLFALQRNSVTELEFGGLLCQQAVLVH
jgi:hypothetical protein